MSTVTVRALSMETWGDFVAMHERSECQGCFCTYWQHEGGDRAYQLLDPSLRRDEKRKRVEEATTHGLLAYAPSGAVVGTLQFEPRGQLPKLTARMPYRDLDGSGVWSVTCFRVLEAHRRAGVARALLRGCVASLASRPDVWALEAYPRRGDDLGDAELLTGPESLFASEGFTCVREHVQYPVWRKRFADF